MTDPDIPQNTIWSFFYPIFKPYKWWLLAIIPAPFATAFYVFGYNYAVKLLLDILTQNKILAYTDFIYPILFYVFSNLLLNIMWRINYYAEWKVQPSIRRDITCKVYEYISNHSYDFFQTNISGSIVSKVKGITDGYYHLLEDIKYNIILPFLIFLVCAISLFCVNSKIFIIITIFTIIIIIMSNTLYRKIAILQGQMSQDYHKIMGFIGDKITNILNIWFLGKKNSELQHLKDYFEYTNIPLQNKYFKLNFWTEILVSIPNLLFGISIFLYLVYLKNTGQITMGDIAFTMSMSYLFNQNIFEMILKFKDFINKWADFKASCSIIITPQEKIDKPNATELKIEKGAILFENINFNYKNGFLVFDNFNLSIKGGQKIGIVGISGVGKSTLISLLLKNFQINLGDILIDNQSIYNVTSSSLRSLISLIPQDVVLFNRSLKENIGYAKPDATIEGIKKIAKIAHLDSFIESLPEKYETQVGERGIKLSGGQRQRIAIARAILKNAPILILDEATSSLDTETEYQIQNSINEILLKKSVTVIAIAHRLSTIKNMDRILVMQDGKIIEDGKFNELIDKKNGEFKRMWNNQINGIIFDNTIKN